MVRLALDVVHRVTNRLKAWWEKKATTYVKHLSGVQSVVNTTNSQHVPLSSSFSCLHPSLSSSVLDLEDSDRS